MHPHIPLLIASALLLACTEPSTAAPKADPPAVPIAAPAPVAPYATRLERVAATRDALAAELTTAPDARRRAAVLARAGEAITSAVADQLAPAWYGTPWAFHGTTRTPGEGKIACGYFVSTLLLDAGLQVERVRLAQQASEHIILSLTGGTHVRRFSNAPLDRFVDAVEAMGAGLFVVGLDNHVGFLVARPGGTRFLHASYAPGQGVVSEDARRSPILGASRYRVVGHLSADPTLTERWLTSAPIVTVLTRKRR